MNATKNFILFAGHTGHRFFPFQAESFEDAQLVAEAKKWFVVDWSVDADGTGIISVVPRSSVEHLLAPVISIR